MERKEVVERLVKGAYDLHMHAAPSPFGRAMDDYGLLQEADAAILASREEEIAALAALAGGTTEVTEENGCVTVGLEFSAGGV